MSNIVLIGMPGCGKSTVGVILAKVLGYAFVDTDLLIQQQSGRRLQEMLDSDGMAAFLEVEERVVCGISADTGETTPLTGDTVIATGGSVVYSERAMAHLRTLGTVVYLKTDLAELTARLSNITTRGVVMRPDQTLADLFAERSGLYERWADVIVPSDDGSVERTVERVVQALTAC